MFQCIYCDRELEKKCSLIIHQKACKNNPNRIQGKNGWSNPNHLFSEESRKKMSESMKGKKCSQETKDKLSKIRIKFLKDNPDKVPYLLNHYSKGDSYPERYFEDVFKNEEIKLTKKYRISLYELDFCDIERKIDIEIDGDQHYLDERIVKSDIKRNNYLEYRGWLVYRIKWSEFQKKTFIEKHEVIQEIKKIINGIEALR